jgi:hypothetical protein
MLCKVKIMKITTALKVTLVLLPLEISLFKSFASLPYNLDNDFNDSIDGSKSPSSIFNQSFFNQSLNDINSIKKSQRSSLLNKAFLDNLPFHSQQQRQSLQIWPSFEDINLAGDDEKGNVSSQKLPTTLSPPKFINDIKNKFLSNNIYKAKIADTFFPSTFTIQINEFSNFFKNLQIQYETTWHGKKALVFGQTVFSLNIMGNKILLDKKYLDKKLQITKDIYIVPAFIRATCVKLHEHIDIDQMLQKILLGTSTKEIFLKNIEMKKKCSNGYVYECSGKEYGEFSAFFVLCEKELDN